MDKAPTLEEKYIEKMKNLEEKIKFLENENQLQKSYIKSLNEQIGLLKEKIINIESNNKNSNQNNKCNVVINTPPPTSSSDLTISEREPICLMTKHHDNYIYCIVLLKNKRLVSGGYDSKIIVYDKNYIHPDLEIKEHSAAVTSLIVSSNSADLITFIINYLRSYYLMSYPFLKGICSRVKKRQLHQR